VIRARVDQLTRRGSLPYVETGLRSPARLFGDRTLRWSPAPGDAAGAPSSPQRVLPRQHLVYRWRAGPKRIQCLRHLVSLGSHGGRAKQQDEAAIPPSG